MISDVKATLNLVLEQDGGSAGVRATAYFAQQSALVCGQIFAGHLATRGVEQKALINNAQSADNVTIALELNCSPVCRKFYVRATAKA